MTTSCQNKYKTLIVLVDGTIIIGRPYKLFVLINNLLFFPNKKKMCYKRRILLVFGFSYLTLMEGGGLGKRDGACVWGESMNGHTTINTTTS